jgi:cytochrome c-type biogenesis protein CcmE
VTATERPPRRRSSRRPLIVLGIVAVALGFLAYKGLGEATTFFRNADEAVAERDELGSRRFRLQGTVVDGSVEPEGTDVRFEVVYHCVTVPVLHRGVRPELFRPGIPVVVEGAFVEGTEKTFEADRIIPKHTEEYKDSEADRLAEAEREACPS